MAFTEEARAKLVAADAADGQTDQTVNQCVMCLLDMKGKPEHTATVEGYTLHFCSSHCKTSFDRDPVRSLLALPDSEK